MKESDIVKAIVLGAGGRMGSRIVALMQETASLRLGAAVERPGHPAVGRDAGEPSGISKLGIPITDDLASAVGLGDVIIDFTAPKSTMQVLSHSVKKNKPMVIGTTGFEPPDLDRIREATRAIPCVLSPNMSVGVNVMFRVAVEVAQLLGADYDIEIVETHHRFKKDAPSGTAMRLAELLARAVNRDLNQVATYSRKGQMGERKRSEIGIQAIRAGDTVGDHTVVFGGLGERLEITHRAHSRDNFARGAIRAAEWIVHQSPGLYEMAHVLGLSH